MERTLYEVLQVSPTASPEVIRSSYRSLARLYHPDLNGEPEADTRMRELNAAYAVLNDSERRARYDAGRAWELRARFKRPSAAPAAERVKSSQSRVPARVASARAHINNRARLRLALLIFALFGLLIISFWLFLELLIDSPLLAFVA